MNMLRGTLISYTITNSVTYMTV